MNIEQFLQDKVRAAVTALYGEPASGQVQIQKTRKEFDGDMTLVVFPLLKLSRKNPEATATEIGEALVASTPEIKSFNVIKGFLNLSLSELFWSERVNEILADPAYGQAAPTGRTLEARWRRWGFRRTSASPSAGIRWACGSGSALRRRSWKIRMCWCSTSRSTRWIGTRWKKFMRC